VKNSSPWEPLLSLRPNLPLSRLEDYAAELVRWNRTIRLVGPRDHPGVCSQVADALLPYLIRPPRFPLLDIGSGAGLPGIALAIVFPDHPVLCLEPRAKRVSFLRHAARLLGLSSVRVLACRAEALPGVHLDLVRSFFTVTARAVADVTHLLAASQPMLHPDGIVMLPRGDTAAPSVPGWILLEDLPYEPVPGLGGRRLSLYRPVIPGVYP
jgi:16S rRNA (guanine527-N7)-methyltransferase